MTQEEHAVRTGKRTGRRPGAPSTREQILVAARLQFARKGFRAATVREIADAAGVDVALLPHYFGSKQNLFTAAQEMPEALKNEFHDALRGSHHDVGTRLTRTYLGLWENDVARPALLATMHSAMGEDESMDATRRMLGGMLGESESDIDPDRKTRLAFAMAELLGVAILRHVTRLPPISDLSFEELVSRVAPSTQAHFDSTL